MRENYLLKAVLSYIGIASVGLFISISVKGEELSAEVRAPLPEMVVTASRLSASMASLSNNALLINRAAIEALGDANAVTLLRKFSDIHIDNPGGLGGVSSLYLRGAEPNYTQVFVDGIAVNDPTNSRGGSFDIGTIDISNVQRIEVLKGPQSAKYGSDSLAGAVNFITKGGSSDALVVLKEGLSTSGGHTHSFSARGPIVGGKGFAVLGATRIDQGRLVKGSSYKNTVIKGNVGLNLSRSDVLDIALRSAQSAGSALPDDSGGELFSKSQSVDHRRATEMSVGVEYNSALLDTWSISSHSSAFKRREIFYSPGVAPGLRSAAGIPINSSETTFEKVVVGGSSEVEIGQKVSAVLGADFSHEAGVSNGRLIIAGAPSDNRFVLGRQNTGVFAEVLWRVRAGWVISGSARHDSPEDFGNVVNRNLGLVHTRMPTSTTIKLNWGEGYKLPSLYALGNELVGDPELLPESNNALEVSVGQKLYDGSANIQLSLFKNRYSNTIDFNSSINKLVNRSVVSNWGGGVDFSWQSRSPLLLKGYVNLAKNNIRGTNERLKNRPEWRAGAYVSWNAGNNLYLNGSFRHVGRALGSSIPTGDRILKAYQVADISTNWSLRSGWKLSLSVDNVFNREFEEAAGFLSPGILARFYLSYRL